MIKETDPLPPTIYLATCVSGHRFGIPAEYQAEAKCPLCQTTKMLTWECESLAELARLKAINAWEAEPSEHNKKPGA